MTPEQTSVPTLDESTSPTGVAETERAETEPIEADLLIEDVSIDGMCGVY